LTAPWPCDSHRLTRPQSSMCNSRYRPSPHCRDALAGHATVQHASRAFRPPPHTARRKLLPSSKNALTKHRTRGTFHLVPRGRTQRNSERRRTSSCRRGHRGRRRTVRWFARSGAIKGKKWEPGPVGRTRRRGLSGPLCALTPFRLQGRSHAPTGDTSASRLATPISRPQQASQPER
jgi:hypothetical protein